MSNFEEFDVNYEAEAPSSRSRHVLAETDTANHNQENCGWNL